MNVKRKGVLIFTACQYAKLGAAKILGFTEYIVCFTDIVPVRIKKTSKDHEKSLHLFS